MTFIWSDEGDFFPIFFLDIILMMRNCWYKSKNWYMRVNAVMIFLLFREFHGVIQKKENDTQKYVDLFSLCIMGSKKLWKQLQILIFRRIMQIFASSFRWISDAWFMNTLLVSIKREVPRNMLYTTKRSIELFSILEKNIFLDFIKYGKI